jgi:hypothetical protein
MLFFCANKFYPPSTCSAYITALKGWMIHGPFRPMTDTGPTILLNLYFFFTFYNYFTFLEISCYFLVRTNSTPPSICSAYITGLKGRMIHGPSHPMTDRGPESSDLAMDRFSDDLARAIFLSRSSWACIHDCVIYVRIDFLKKLSYYYEKTDYYY